MTEVVYNLWLQRALGAGSSKPRRILENYGNYKQFYEAGEDSWRLDGIFTLKELEKLKFSTLAEADALLEYCERLGQRVLTPDSPEFPLLLKEISNPPCALFVKGELPDVDNVPAVAIVGTRRATRSGISAASAFAYELAKSGAVVVSGGALGVDTAAHKGALRAQGKTICVLGCGIGYPYLMQNESLREAVSQSGALVSEYPPNSPATNSTFPIRNRIISGLCVGTLVVEAAAKSGSLITADFALEQGRDVFAVPNGIFSPVSQGVNRLIQNGAKPVCGVGDILEEYLNRFPGKINWDNSSGAVVLPKEKTEEEAFSFPGNTPQKLGSSFSKAAGMLYSKLVQEPKHITFFAAETGLPVPQLLAAVTELELAGKIESLSGRRYRLPD